MKNKIKTSIGLALFLINGCTNLQYQKSDHCDGQKFSNFGKTIDKSLWQLLKWKFTKKEVKWPDWRTNTTSASIDISKQVTQDPFSTTFINHATHLIQFSNLNIITDPVFSEYVGPFYLFGPKRHHPPKIALSNLPNINIVLISHNHYDHMDRKSVYDITNKFNPTFIVPLGNFQTLSSMGAKKIIELDWWQETTIEQTKITLVPAQHWSRRGLFDQNRTLWGGFVIQIKNIKVYFAGDTGYGDFFKKINQKFGPMNLSFIPIGSYEPRWIMSEQHMNPEEAVQAHIDLKSKLSIGTHFGTFQLADEGIDDPYTQLQIAIKKLKIHPNTFIIN